MQAEKTHKAEGIAITIAFHAALLLLFYFMILTPPDPPLSEAPTMGGGGVELNFGDIDAGTGDLTNLLPANSEPASQENTQVEETPSEEEPTPTETAEETVTPTESEDAVAINAKEEEKEQKTEPKKTEVTKPAEEKKSEPKIDPKFVWNKNKGSNTSGNSDKAGEDKNKAGNPGNPNGLDEKGKYTMGEQGKGGGKGGGEGTGTGVGFGDGYGNWKFVGEPKPKDESAEEGKLYITITVDQDGEIINAVVTKNLGISPSVARLYVNHLKNSQDLTVAPPAGAEIPASGVNIPVIFTITAK